MYTTFFGLTEKPFSITPDPRYLYMSRRHTDALAHLIYGISESGGFIQLTGEVGTGKTTLIRTLLEQLPAKADIALILNPQLSTKEFLQVICEELRTPSPIDDTVKARIDCLNIQLLKVHAEGRRVVVIVDEAQTLSPELLEQVRLLTNLETARQKLMQIILIGQPELRDLLDRQEMRQIAQRVTGRYHLEPLSAEETAAYVQHRMSVAGSQSIVFTRSAIRQLYKRARGIPRLINVIADRALLAAYTQDRHKVDGWLVGRAAAEVFGGRRPGGRWWPWAAIGVGIASFALATTNLWRDQSEHSAELDASSALAALDVSRAAAEPTIAEAAAAPDAQTAARPAAPPATAPSAALGAASVAPHSFESSNAAPAAAGATTPSSAQPALTFAALLVDPSFSTDTDTAIGELLALWGGRYDPLRGNPCEQAERAGLACLFQDEGSLGELRLMNRPAILSLRDPNGKNHAVVVAELNADKARLVSNGKVFEIPLAELTDHWFGDELVVWRPGMAQVKELTPGIDDPGVLWLRETLAKIEGTAPRGGTSPVYDAALEARVREYQRTRMLDVDGIVGALTQIVMTTELDMPPKPRLLPSTH